MHAARHQEATVVEYLKVVFLKILNTLLCRVFANQVTYVYYHKLQCITSEVNNYFSYNNYDIIIIIASLKTIRVLTYVYTIATVCDINVKLSLGCLAYTT